MQQAITMLDSGVGGLTVVKEVMRQLPQEKIIYFGDTARSPYGSRTAGEVRLFTRQIVNYLIQFQPKLLVIACNTATAAALESIRTCIPIPVIGVIYPGVRAALSVTNSGCIGVIGTEGTIQSGVYEKTLKRLFPQAKVVSVACPRLASLVERGKFWDIESIHDVVRSSLEPLHSLPIDTLILGCTHYPFLHDSIQKVVGPQVQLINSAAETAREIRTILCHNSQLNDSRTVPAHQFICSGDPEMFQQIARSWLGENISAAPVTWQIPRII